MPLKVGREEAMGTRPKKKEILKDPSVPAWLTLKLRWFMRHVFLQEWACFEVFQCVLDCLLLDESSNRSFGLVHLWDICSQLVSGFFEHWARPEDVFMCL